MKRMWSTRRWRAIGIACLALALVGSLAGSAAARRGSGDGHGGDGHGHGHDGGGQRPVRAALPPGAIQHIVVLDLENAGFATTFGPTSPATYLNGTLLKQGELLSNYYAVGHASLDNYIAQVSGQAPTEETSADCLGTGADPTSLIGSYNDLLPGTPDPNQSLYPGQVDGHGCIFPSAVKTIASQLDAVAPPNPWTHVAAWRQYSQDMGNDPTGARSARPTRSAASTAGIRRSTASTTRTPRPRRTSTRRATTASPTSTR